MWQGRMLWRQRQKNSPDIYCVPLPRGDVLHMKVEWISPCYVFQGLLKIKLLPRLRYILEVVRPSPRVVQDILEILTRIARHSSSSATQVVWFLIGSYDSTSRILRCCSNNYTNSVDKSEHPNSWIHSPQLVCKKRPVNWILKTIPI